MYLQEVKTGICVIIPCDINANKFTGDKKIPAGATDTRVEIILPEEGLSGDHSLGEASGPVHPASPAVWGCLVSPGASTVLPGGHNPNSKLNFAADHKMPDLLSR